ncbi:MAG: WD40-repeat-containing domain protein, partial [Piptocephalis tieghemiana]
SQVILSAGDAEGSLQLRDLWTGTLLSSYKQYASALPASVALVASPKAGSLPRSLLTLPTTKPMIHAYALYKDQPTLRISAPEKLVAITTSVKGTFCAAASPEGRIHLWDLASGELLVSWIAHYRTIRALAFTDDEICLVSAGEDATVNVWSLSTIIRLSSSSSSAPKPLHTWTDHSLPVMALSLSSGPHTHARVFTCSLDQTVKVWSISTGLLLGSLLFPMPLHTLALAPTELAVYVAGPRRPGEVLRADLHRLRSHPQYPSVMRSIMQGKSGNDVVGIGLDQSVDTVQPAIYPITSSTATSSSSSSSPITIPSLALSLDGTMLVGGCSDGSLRIWDTTSRQLLRSILVNKGPIHALHTFLVDPADLMSPAKPKSQIPGPVPLQRSIRPGKED